MTLDLVPSDEKILPPVPPPVTDTDASTDSTISVGILESYASRAFLEDGLSDYLEKKCWPIGLQKLLVEELKDIPTRFFISDDSGTMMFPDGHKLVGEGESAR